MDFLRWVILMMFLGSPLLHGDYIYLKTGRKIEGTVIEERADAIVFEMPMGTITYDRSKVDRIEYNEAGDQQRELIAQTQAFDSEIRSLKKAMAGLYSEKTTVRLLLNRARDAEAEVKSAEHQLLETRKDLVKARKDFEPFAKYSGRTVSIQIHEKYMSLRTRVNSLVDEVQSLEDEVTRLSQRKYEVDNKMMQAEQELMQEVTELRARYQDLLARGCPPDAMESINRMLEAEGSFSERQVIPLRKVGNSYIVSVRINNTLTEDFILDTGCSDMFLTPEMFQKLNLSQEHVLGKVHAGIASGEDIEVQEVNLVTVQVGAFTVSNVEASVPTTFDQNVPALLGMSFLKHFHFSVDSAGGRLILERIGE